uniref:Uncharacterized protein n=1 Tax=Octactis speculum TaxID=3111310 RepID=A0A7S2GGW1_9STRA|mmetsp:Transcript_46386/g.63165  ORF Transcript_46386/g.63165 Transcript_46386/m.63165 type:complete len:197 (+) Transcript_46386:97-687(+)|eukprot:CAMPEP_0185776302 /NCGR_PEP_ID=MMETSP1174-20130828/85161_1 /TAXON_ID=35687 /ORGANISM="Dictyocha speculum, Strain CCMP1381" /LENGTH=196 /DNA_ID=CAMNT_0028464195 /DNA_START=84 /DNA_END=674 /DNA_ORIENTATION=+
MGAGASVPDVMTFEEAKALAGEQWDDKLTAFWPEGKNQISKDQLMGIIQNIPMFAKRPTNSDRMNWDEKALSPATDNTAAMDSAEASKGPAVQRSKPPRSQKRDKMDTEELRIRRLAESNGTTVEEIKASRAKSSGLPPKPRRSVEERQSFKAHIRDSKKAASEAGRPPSRGLDEMECQVLFKPKEGGTKPEVMII